MYFPDFNGGQDVVIHTVEIPPKSKYVCFVLFACELDSNSNTRGLVWFL